MIDNNLFSTSWLWANCFIFETLCVQDLSRYKADPLLSLIISIND